MKNTFKKTTGQQSNKNVDAETSVELDWAGDDFLHQSDFDSAEEFGLGLEMTEDHGPNGYPIVVVSGRRADIVKWMVKIYSSDNLNDQEANDIIDGK